MVWVGRGCQGAGCAWADSLLHGVCCFSILRVGSPTVTLTGQCLPRQCRFQKVAGGSAALQALVVCCCLCCRLSSARCYCCRCCYCCSWQVIYHGPESVSTVANEVQLMLSLNHPNIIRAYHCVTKQLVAAQLPTSHSVSQPPQLPVQLAGRGSTGSSGPQHLPASGSTASAAVQSALLQGVEVTALRQSSSIMTASSALSAVQPSTPPLAGLEPPAAASAAASAKSGTGTQSLSQAGLTSSSGVGSFVSDLEHPAPSSSLLQAYQRKGNLGQQMQPSLAAAAAVSTPVGSSAFAGAAAQQQQQQEQDDAAAGSSFTASAAAADVRSIGPGPGYAVMTLPQAAASGPAAAVHPTPSLPVVGSGAVRPQAQQFLAPSLSTGSTAAAAPAAPGPGPSIPSSSSSGPSRGSLGSLAWPLIMSSRDASEALGVQGGGPQPEGSAYLANRNSAAGNVVGGGDVDTWRTERDATALVETWLVTELADRWGADASGLCSLPPASVPIGFEMLVQSAAHARAMQCITTSGPPSLKDTMRCGRAARGSCGPMHCQC